MKSMIFRYPNFYCDITMDDPYYEEQKFKSYGIKMKKLWPFKKISYLSVVRKVYKTLSWPCKLKSRMVHVKKLRGLGQGDRLWKSWLKLFIC